MTTFTIGERRHVPKKTTSMPAAEFKAKCLKVMEAVRATGAEYVITKHGKPVAKLVPVGRDVTPLLGRLAGNIIREGNIIAPIKATWNAKRG